MNNQTIRKAIKNILTINDFKTREIKTYWNKELLETNNFYEGLARDGAVKEIKSLIESYELEKDSNEMQDYKIDIIEKVILDYLNTDNQSEISKLFNGLNNISSLEDIESGVNVFSYDSIESINIDIIDTIYNCITMVENFERYIQNDREQKSNIKNLENVKELASKYNNQKLIEELNNMIELIQNEDFITREIIIKSCFFNLHYILSRKFPKTTKAKDYANSLIQSFFNTSKQYKPTNKIDKKVFFENGSKISRELFYYKS